MLEEYVEGFLQLYNEMRRDDETLKHLFWSGMEWISSARCSCWGRITVLSLSFLITPCGCADRHSAWESSRMMPRSTPTPWHILHHQQPSLCPLQKGPVIPAWNVLEGMKDFLPAPVATPKHILDEPVPPCYLPTPLSPALTPSRP